MSPLLPEPASLGPDAAGDRRLVRLRALGPERAHFRELIGKVGSGEHTSTGLDRQEAGVAMDLMLQGQADDAQMGAFLIAHRIRRPHPIELSGMLDSYRRWGPVLETPGRRPLCFGVPYDGRSRTAPLLPLVALVLASDDLPVVLHGGDPMPVKFGVTLAELFESIGIPSTGLPLSKVQERLDRHGLALTNQPDHFPLAEKLVPVRDAIGKRPPVASLELLWTPHRGEHLLVSGFVHPPTETRAWQALRDCGETDLLTVKGLEGSTDLPTSRAGITARVRQGATERILLHPRDHGIATAEVAWENLEAWRTQALAALCGEGPLAPALRWNVAAYLWFAGRFERLEDALERATGLLMARSGERLRRDMTERGEENSRPAPT
jgi:anthranilate phosphoribosyltransferase